MNSSRCGVGGPQRSFSVGLITCCLGNKLIMQIIFHQTTTQQGHSTRTFSYIDMRLEPNDGFIDDRSCVSSFQGCRYKNTSRFVHPSVHNCAKHKTFSIMLIFSVCSCTLVLQSQVNLQHFNGRAAVTSHLETMTMLCTMFVNFGHLHRLLSQVCRMNKRCHAWCIALRTIQRALCHYKSGWEKNGWLRCEVKWTKCWIDSIKVSLSQSFCFIPWLSEALHIFIVQLECFFSFSKFKTCTFLRTCAQTCDFIINIPRENLSVPKDGPGRNQIISASASSRKLRSASYPASCLPSSLPPY